MAVRIGKKIGEYTAIGTMGISSTSIGGDRKRIQLDDGNMKTGYIVKRFYIWALDTECHATLATIDREGVSGSAHDYMMDAGDNAQIAWASSPSSGVGPFNDGIVDPENLVIQDLYIRGYATSTSQPWNYYIEMDKVEIDEWRTAIALVRNRSQSQVDGA